MNTKLSNGQQFDNPCFQDSFGEYLLQNHWRMTSQKSDISFFKFKMQLRIKNECMDFFTFNDDPTIQKWEFKGSFTGLSTLETVNEFILLLHAMNIQDLREWEDNAATIDAQHGVEARVVIRGLMGLLNQKPVPHNGKG